MRHRFIKALFLGTALCTFPVTGAVAQGLAGPYLAGSQALMDGEFNSAGRYFVKAMTADTSNITLKQSALLSYVSSGDFMVAATIASVMPTTDEDSILANLVLLVDHVNKGNYASAQLLLPSDNIQLSPILSGLLDAWIKVGKNDRKGALAAFDAMASNESVALFGQYHKGIALAYFGDFEAAAEILNGVDGPLHLNRDSIVAHVQILSELGQNENALQVLDDAFARGFRDAQLVDLRGQVASGTKIPFTQVITPTYGMSEAFVVMADALNRGEPSRTALFYARLAQALRPDHVDASLIIAELLEQEGQFALAGEAYASVPRSSPSYRDAEAGRADMMRLSGDIDGATQVLLALVDTFPNDIVTVNDLGELYRLNGDFEQAAEAYSQAIDSLPGDEARFWVIYYSRGITYERLDQWPLAEADFRKALELSPDQPFVLNYLGYSYIEMDINLEEAQSMIETAVAGRPDNGFITDSLAWVLYRLGKFEEAVAPMERAAELLPVDPIVNDHLGDVLWMVGRKFEAEFQWRRAQSFDPEPEDATRIKRKLEVGLDVVLEEEANE